MVAKASRPLGHRPVNRSQNSRFNRVAPLYAAHHVRLKSLLRGPLLNSCLNPYPAYDACRVRLKAFYATNESAWLMGNSQKCRPNFHKFGH